MRILAIGDTDSLAETRRVLSRSEFEMYRVPAALAAADMVRRIPFDLMIVAHPLADAEFSQFHGEIRRRDSPCRESQLLVLAPHSRLTELDALREDPLFEAIDTSLPQHRLAEAASRYLGPIRAATRYDLQLRVTWQAADRESHTEDISASGALIVFETSDRPAVGERFELRLATPQTHIALPSEVIRLTEAPADKARGFAVTWIRADVQELQRLDDLLTDLG